MQILQVMSYGVRAQRVVLCCAAALLFSAPTRGQIAGSGNIQGTITDSSGAVVPNASVSLTDESTHVAHRSTTDNADVYVFPNIPIGTYDLNITAEGFRTYLRTGNVRISEGKFTIGGGTNSVAHLMTTP